MWVSLYVCTYVRMYMCVYVYEFVIDIYKHLLWCSLCLTSWCQANYKLTVVLTVTCSGLKQCDQCKTPNVYLGPLNTSINRWLLNDAQGQNAVNHLKQEPSVPRNSWTYFLVPWLTSAIINKTRNLHYFFSFLDLQRSLIVNLTEVQTKVYY